MSLSVSVKPDIIHFLHRGRLRSKGTTAPVRAERATSRGDRQRLLAPRRTIGTSATTHPRPVFTSQGCCGLALTFTGAVTARNYDGAIALHCVSCATKSIFFIFGFVVDAVILRLSLERKINFVVCDALSVMTRKLGRVVFRDVSVMKLLGGSVCDVVHRG